MRIQIGLVVKGGRMKRRNCAIRSSWDGDVGEELLPLLDYYLGGDGLPSYILCSRTGEMHQST